MATYVNDLRLKEISTGDESGTWGTSTNTNLELIGEALGYATQQVFGSDADATTTIADGASDPARAMYFKITSAGSLTATRTCTIAPNTVSRVMFIENATTGSQSIAISQGSGANVTIAAGKTAVVYLDGAGATAAVVDAMAGVDPGVTDTLTEVLVAGNTSGGTNIELSTTDKVQFRDAAIYINSSVDGQLDIVADTEIQIAATTIDINGAVDVSGTLGVTGVATLASLVATTADINAGTIDGTVIGGTTPAALSATTGSFSSTLGVTGAATFSGALTTTSGMTVSAVNAIYNATGTTGWSGYGTTNNGGGVIIGLDDGATFGNVIGTALIRHSAGKDFVIKRDTTDELRINGSTGAATFSGSVTANGLTVSNASGGAVASFTNTSDADLSINLTSGVSLITPTTGILAFGTSSTERMRIDASGNLGIGVVPSAWGTGSGVRGLEVGANLAASQDINSVYFSANAYNSATGWKYRNTQYASNLRMGTNDGVFQFQQAASGTAGAAITWATSMTLDASGNLLVGDTTAAARLWVKRTDAGNLIGGRATNATYTSTVGFFGADRNTTDNSFHYIDCYNYGSSTYRFRVADSGNATNTNNSYGALSDVKLKENIIDSGSQWDDIKALRVRKYSLKSDSLDAPNKLGVIAQELESVGMAGLVSESEDRDEEGNNLGTVTKTVAYSVLYMKAVKALQEAMERIETLEAKVAALES
jgi:hypothetical protein